MNIFEDISIFYMYLLFNNLLIDKEIIEKYTYINWTKLSRLKNLDIDFLRKYKDFLRLDIISKVKVLLEDIIDEFKEYVEEKYLYDENFLKVF